jgi:hydroxymethylpyrimidine pyrophosphatase-like HAD family hydrolase
MDPKLAAELCGLFESNGHAALALQDTDEAGVDYLITDRVDLNEATRQWMKLTQATYHRDRVQRLGDYHHRHTMRVGIVAPQDEITRIHTILEARYHGRITYHRLVIPSYGVEVLEAFDPSVSKWNAILRIADSHNIYPEQIIAVGDDLNDLSMIQNAGLGVAMGNAHPEILRIAGRILKCNHEEGLSAFLEELADATEATEEVAA